MSLEQASSLITDPFSHGAAESFFGGLHILGHSKTGIHWLGFRFRRSLTATLPLPGEWIGRLARDFVACATQERAGR